jgi:hypothetical protein
MRTILGALMAAVVACAPQVASSAEGGSGVYVLGLRGPGSAITPPPGVYFSNQLLIYSGGISGNVPLEGGSLAGDARLRAVATIPVLLFVTPFEFAGGRLGVTVTTPYGHADIAGRLGPISREDRLAALADPAAGAFLGWRHESFHWQLGFNGFMPIGDYRVGRLANVAKHRGAIDVYAGLTWFDPAIGIDVTNTWGVTFNQPNEITRYRTGTEFHWDWSVTKRFDNGFSIGPTGYLYRQLTGDSGPGAALGAFQGEVWALGVALGQEFRIGDVPVTARLRYFREMDARRRFLGDAAFVGISFPLWVAGR